MKAWKYYLIVPILFLLVSVPGCGGGNSNDSMMGPEPPPPIGDPMPPAPKPPMDPTDNFGYGLGVSGLLFENNLVLYDRARSNRENYDLILLPQMYYTSIDVPNNFPVLGTFPKDEVASGNVKVDDIPAITEPFMVPPDGIDFMTDDDPIIGVTVNGETRGYPHNLLWWHETINDKIGGEKVTITYCPLTGTGLVFDTTVPRDRLVMIPYIEVNWGLWKKLHPDALVANGENSNRPLGTYPFGNYRDELTSPSFALRIHPLDTRFPPKRLVQGVIINGQQKAYPFPNFADKDAVNDRVGGTPVLVVFDRADRLAISYSRQVNGRELTFSVVDGGTPFRLKDNETGTVWTIEGKAIQGELTGASLNQITQAYNAFWFAWADFWPNTQVYP